MFLFRRTATLKARALNRLAAPALYVSAAVLLTIANPVLSQEEGESGIEIANSENRDNKRAKEQSLETIVVRGIRRSIQDAALMKRNASQIMDVITAEDMGKLPDENVAESLRRVTGVQIGNRNGQASNIRIRGMSQVNIEVNGNTYVGAGVRPDLRSASNRNISLDDIPSDIISAIEVVKAPSADMNEGALTGTVNLVTRKGLDLDAGENFVGATAKNTYSDVAEENTQQYSLFLGKNWEDRFGVMVTLTDKETLTRNDSVSYNRWSAIPFIGADPEAQGQPAFITATDDSGRTGIAIAPQSINLEQQSVLQDSQAVDVMLQFKPKDNLSFYLQGVYTSYDEEVSTNTLDFGLFDINTGAGIALNDFQSLGFGEFTPGTTARDLSGNVINVDGEVTLTQGGFEIPSQATGGDSHTASGQVGARDVVNTNISFGGTWNSDKLDISTNFSFGESTFDSAWMSQSLKGSFGNANCAFRDPRPLDPFSGLPVDCSENLRFGFDMNAGEQGSVFIDPSLSGVNPNIEGGGDFLTDPFSYVLGFTGLFKDEFRSRNDSGQVDFDYNMNIGFVKNFEFGARWNKRGNDRTAYRGVSDHWRFECTLEEFQLSPQECANAGALFTDKRIGAEEANSLFVQPPERQNLAVITDGSFMSGVDGASAFPSQWISGNADVFADDPERKLMEVFGMFPMSDKEQDFSIEEETLAGYIKVNFSGEKNRVTGNLGLRVAHTDTQSYSYTAADDAISQVLFDDLFADNDFVGQRQSTENTEYLPSVNLNWELTDEFMVRWAANRSISRPDLGALIPGTNVTNVNARTGTKGNPDLDPWRVNQTDLSFEWFFNEEQGGFASLALFYKDIDTFITTQSGIIEECRARGQTVLCDFTQSVNDSGEIRGLEVSYNQPLPWGFGVQTNYTYLDSEAANGLEVPGNSENTYNLIAYFQNYGFGARLAWTWQDEFLNTATGFGGRPEFTKERGELDLTLNYDLGDNLSFSVSGTNLLQESQESFVQIEERLLKAEQFDRTVVFSVRGRF